jgi:hypothetical protein
LWLVPTFAAAVADGDMPAALSRLLEVAQARREAALGGSCETGRRDYDEYWSDWRRGDCCVACCLKVCCWGPGPAFVTFLRCLISADCHMPPSFTAEELEWQLRFGGWYTHFACFQRRTRHTATCRSAISSPGCVTTAAAAGQGRSSCRPCRTGLR